MSYRFKPIHLLEAFMILLAFVFIYPALFVLVSALKPDADIMLRPLALPSSLFLDNFVKAWKVMEFPQVAATTLLITTLGVAGIVLSSSMAAWMLARTEKRYAWLIYSVFAFALVIPFQIIMVPLAVLASDLGFTNPLGIVVLYWGLGAPMAVFMFHGFVKSVPKELEESAAIDGAGTAFIFFRIVFPLLKPITATIAVLDALWIWNDFLLPLLVIKQGTIQLAQMQFYGQFLKEYGPLTASLVLSAIPIIVFYLALQKYIIKGIAAGAVKG
ncbi:MAG: carbohydrate ABC transporter permease [Spirochaetia bacterium]|jgi:raffinose/stachyose/melibiose transport system permease protein|nr:carbohydrate ABC transporter permease [Spirochaetia bacterium]